MRHGKCTSVHDCAVKYIGKSKKERFTGGQTDKVGWIDGHGGQTIQIRVREFTCRLTFWICACNLSFFISWRSFAIFSWSSSFSCFSVSCCSSRRVVASWNNSVIFLCSVSICLCSASICLCSAIICLCSAFIRSCFSVNWRRSFAISSTNACRFWLLPWCGSVHKHR